ncbi:hypothetical protein OAS39_08570 [Pirellulales bacterium]|nr:hypothetical protein [Pirellulales bacterium]
MSKTLRTIVSIAIVALLLIHSALAADGPFALVNVGGSGGSDFPGFVANVPAAGGYSEFADVIGPKFKAGGYKRLWIHNPGGHWSLWQRWDDTLSIDGNRRKALEAGFGSYTRTRLMRINQWLLAEQAGLAWADRQELRIFHDTMMADYGAEQILYYFGGPDYVSTEYAELCLEPFLGLQNPSFGFDHIIRNERYAGIQGICKVIRERNPKALIYTEPRPYEQIDRKLTKIVSGTVAARFFDVDHPIGTKPEVQEWAREIGDYVQIVDRDENGNFPEPEEGVIQAHRGALN